MNVLVTGNKGYIGSVLVETLKAKGYTVVGYDTGYYDGCSLYEVPQAHRQIKKDIRDVSLEDLKNIDCVIHLAALSNDPLCEFEPRLTEEINFQATVKLANLAKAAGVKRFLYSSSQSMYGASKTDEELEEEKGEKNPVTVYGLTKWEAEKELKKICDDNFMVVCFRPSTVFGASPMLRCDIVFNSMVAHAYTRGLIEIRSVGTWRPVVHIKDVCNAFVAGLTAPKELLNGKSFNIGIPGGNFTVQSIAEAAKKIVPHANFIMTGENKDNRNYKISFKRILTELGDYYKPQWDLQKGGEELLTMFKRVDFTEEKLKLLTNRLPYMKSLIEAKAVDKDLRWI